MTETEKALEKIFNEFEKEMERCDNTKKYIPAFLEGIDNQPPQDFSGCKVGDKLWSIELGECEVKYVGEKIIEVESKTKKERFYLDGKYDHDDEIQSLFFSKPIIIAPAQPKRKVKKLVNGWFNIYQNNQNKEIFFGSGNYETQKEAVSQIEKKEYTTYLTTAYLEQEIEVEE